MNLHVLEHGYIEAVDSAFFTPSGEIELVTTTWPVRSYLIEHSSGWLLWDTGMPEKSLLADPMALGKMKMEITAPIGTWLEQFGLTTQSEIQIGVSHMHIDHGGNMYQFPNATFLVAEDEYRIATSPTPPGPYHVPGYDGITERKVQQIRGVRDVFGDGVAVIHPSPGHSAGHQSLLVSIPERRPVLLIGDVCYSVDDFDHPRAPDWNYDRAATFRTMTAMVELAARTGAIIAVHHDPAAVYG